MKKFLTLAFAFALVSLPALAGPVVITGDGDPFPVACSDFSGIWRSDQNQVYSVGQKGCEWLKIVKSDGGINFSVTIVPDGVSRSIYGTEWKGTVRHRWNSQRFGAVVETHRKMVFSAKTVTEFVTLEEVNDNLLLENTYRVIAQAEGEGQPKYEYSQQVFRREGAARTKPADGTGEKGSSL
jgi:hypothetical protein